MDIASAIANSDFGLNQLLSSSVQTLLAVSGAETCRIICWENPTDSTTERPSFRLRVQGLQHQPPQPLSIPIDQSSNLPLSLIQRVIQSPETVIIDDLSSTPWQSDPYFQQHLSHSVFCLPLKVGEQLLGLVYLEDYPTPLTPHCLDILDSLATQLSLSLHQAEQIHSLQDQVESLSTQLQQETQTRQTQALLEREQFLSSIYDGVEYPIFVVDIVPENPENPSQFDFHYVGWNTSAERLTGISQQWIVGKTPEQIYGLPKGQVERQRLIQCWQQGSYLSYEEQLMFFEQETWWITTLNPLKDSSGHVYRIVGTAFDITELKQTETELQQFATLIQNIPDLISIISLEGETVYLNPAGCQLVGLSDHKTARTIPFEQYLFPEDRSQLQNTILPTVMEQGVWQGEFRLRQFQTHEPILVEQNLFLVIDSETGKPLCFASVTRDIGERKQAEQALRDSEAKFRQLAENIEGVFWMRDIATEAILYVSPAYEKIWGRSCEELYRCPHSWLDSVHPDDRYRVKASLPQRTQPGYEIEYRIIQSYGELRWIRDRAFPIPDQTGQVYRLVGTAEDITDRKQLEEIQQQLVAILEASPDYVSMNDLHGHIFWLNTHARQLYGLPLFGEMLPLELNDCYPHWALDQIKNQGLPMAMAEGVWIGETAVVSASGQEIPVSQVIIAHKNSDGTIENFSSIARDISQLKQAEQALRQANIELENRVENRTAELKVAKEAAEVANRAKSEFLANMSHELRTPLNGILGYAQILQRSSTLKTDEKYGIQVIYQCGSHLLTLINDVLDLCKIEAQKMELYPDEFHFQQFLMGIVKLCKIRAHQKGIQFIYQPSPNLPDRIIADEKRLRQVLLNLLSNGIKFTSSGSVTLTIDRNPTTVIEKNEECLIRFQVKDTGIGINHQQLEKIFLPFEQVGKISHQQEGTGLGLAITHKILQLMNTQLEVETIPGKGSIFSFEVSLICRVDTPSKQLQSLTKQIIGYTGEQKTILIVDDSPENLDVLRDLLQPLGFKMILADHATVALEQALTQKPDLVITDVVMPEVDGLELTRRLRLYPTLNQVPVIAVSASVSNFDQLKSQAAGCNCFLPKPIQAEEIYQYISELLMIDWEYEASNQSPEMIEEEPIIFPPATELLELKQLIKKGRITMIEQAAHKLKQIDIQYHPFAQKLIHFAREFEIEQLQAFIAKASE